MSTASVPANELVNKGFIVRHSGASTPGAHPDVSAPAYAGRTFIVTGLHRSGTSLVAAVLRQVGIFMGAEINDIVHEDEAIARVLLAQDIAGLKHLIDERNANFGTWGFKFPMLSQLLPPGAIALFSNPHLIVPFRDPVSMAVRTSLSEYQEPMPALLAAIDDLAGLVRFIDQLDCPALLLSYEKSLVFPNDFIDAIIQFCGLPRSDGLRDRLVRLIEPNRPVYIAQARRRYEGIIEGVTGLGLRGWCRLTGVADPVSLDLIVDEQRVRTVVADVFRQDLLDAGFGTGHHGFVVDRGILGSRPNAIIRMQVAEHGIELDNSGRRLREYGDHR